MKFSFEFQTMGSSTPKVFKLAHSQNLTVNALFMTCKNASIKVQIQRPNDSRIKFFFLAGLMFCSVLAASAQDRRQIWTDSAFQTLSFKEKIGQVFMIKMPSTLSESDREMVRDQIKDFQIGGVWIGSGGPKATALFINEIQASSKIPLLTGIGASSGLGESLDSTLTFMNPIAMGAVRNDSLIYAAAEITASQLKLLGLQVNFGPNTSSLKNDAHYEKFYSDDKIRTSRKALNILHGFQDHGVLVCPLPVVKALGKNPDGTDSVIVYEPVRVDTSELHALRKLISSGTAMVMTSQIPYSVMESKKYLPACLSPSFMNETLGSAMGFKGLALCEVPIPLKRTKGEKKKKKGQLEIQAIMAGNHMLVNSPNVNQTIKLVLKSAKKNPAIVAKIDAAVRKILEAKYDAGLSRRLGADIDNLNLKLNTPHAKLLQHEIAEAAITVTRNTNQVIPVRRLEDRTFAVLSVGKSEANEFSRYLGKYTGFDKLSLNSLKDSAGLFAKLSKYDVIVVGFFPDVISWQDALSPMLKNLAASKNVILTFFQHPNSMKNFAEYSSVIAGYADNDLLEKMAAQIIFGGMEGHGALPVTVTSSLHEGFGIITPRTGRLSYTLPEAAGMDSKTLEDIIPIANETIAMKASPGMEVLVARHGKIIYEKPFGYLTYDKKSPVTDETLYDLASVTKVSATLQTVMFMQEHKLIDINKKMSVYLPDFRKSNKKDFTLKDILTHQAGLWPFLPFWAQTVKDTVHLPLYYARQGTPEYPYPVSRNMYASRGMRDSLYHWILNAKVVDKTTRVPYDYRYSDMGFFMLMHLAEKMLNQPMDRFLEQNFYEVLGASTTGYLPLLKFPASRIAPTENDKLFRRSQLVGYVHDQLAAMNGGVAGHAGLFSTANDLAKLGQMWLQKGSYAGHQFFKPETVDFFTKKQFENSRRGLGWDKPTISDPNGPTSAYASAQTFGHTGFTGISIWVDPQYDLVFIFFSNRVYPEMTNNKILNANIRPRVQDVVYKSIFNYCANH